MTENVQPKAETLLEQLRVLDAYLLDRSNRVGRHEDGAMAYENSARLLRNILKGRTEPEVEWGVQYADGNDNLHEWWGFDSDPRLPRVINGVEYEPRIEADGVIYLTDDPGWVKSVSKRSKPVQIAPWEAIDKTSKKDS